jgi:hypothetical protein
MRNHFVFSILTITVLTTGALLVGAQSGNTYRPDLKADPKVGATDLTGVWHVQGQSMDLSKLVVPGDQLVLTPYGQERFKTVDHSKDPSVRCLPFGPVRAVCCLVHPNMIIQHPNVVAFLTESQRTYRLIYTDGRGHPPDIDDYPDWFGSSIGHWEGNTLVVETLGIDERTWLDNGHEHSSKLKLLEKFQKVDADTIRWTVTFDDPVFFVKPFTTALTLKRQVGDRILSHSCLENEKDVEHMLPTIGGVQ